MIPKNQTIQELEAALKDLLERQTREAAIPTEAMKRAEAMASKKQALLKETEKRETKLKERLQNKPFVVGDDEKMTESRDCTLKPSTVVGGSSAKEKNKHPFLLPILAEELPKKFRYLVEIETYDRTNAIKCKAFTINLKKDALTWFNSLPANSIESFSDLFESFLRTSPPGENSQKPRGSRDREYTGSSRDRDDDRRTRRRVSSPDNKSDGIKTIEGNAEPGGKSK
ncbi:hypothetical protein PIB30_056434 [Stylosanthes scabra]|uniref:Retrotransposon gag domain-containing protein n=1 Tax=Stylosanthes scabra TaxID=79078 RepID=A0ABU6TJ68_9FABA|nr:hypothetical protein [Stylosanthes scabra]